MEVLGAEFGDMSPQELAAPVNTVAVSLEEMQTETFLHHEHREANANIVASNRKQH